MSRIARIALAALAVVVAAPRAAQAADATNTFTVTAAVAKTCSVSAAAVVLPGYDPNSTAATVGTTNVNVTCTRGTSYTTTLKSTNNWNLVDTVTPANKLSYKITQGATTTAWDANTGWAGVAGSRAAQTYVATVTVPPTQDVPAGTYVDTVTVNVNY